LKGEHDAELSTLRNKLGVATAALEKAKQSMKLPSASVWLSKRRNFKPNLRKPTGFSRKLARAKRKLLPNFKPSIQLFCDKKTKKPPQPSKPPKRSTIML